MHTAGRERRESGGGRVFDRSRCEALRVRRPFKRKPPPPRFVTAEIVNFILLL